MNDSKLATEHSGIKHADRKLKKSPSICSTGDPKTQKSISDHFAPSKQRSVSHEAQATTPNKRLKLNHSPPSPDSSNALSGIKSPGDMSGGNPGENPKYIRAQETSLATPNTLVNGRAPLPSANIVQSPPRKGAIQAPPKLPRNLVVKNLRRSSRADRDQYLDQLWEQLDSGLSALLRDNAIPKSKEELYKGVETLCRQDRAPSLYKKLCSKCRHEVSVLLREPLLEQVSSLVDADALRVVIEAWSSWSSHLATIRSIFFYLDRSYLLHTASLASIEEMGVAEFRSQVYADAVLNRKILQGACDLLSEARQGHAQNERDDLLQAAIRMFHTLAVYSKEFEPKLMSESEHFFIAWGHESDKGSLADYVKECQALIDCELRQCELYGLDTSTRKGIESYMEDVLIQQKQTMLSSIEDVSKLLVQNNVDALNQLFSLLQRRGLGEKLKPAFESFIIEQGSNIVFDEKREQEMVVRLLEFKKRLDYLLEHAFQMHEGLGHTLREAFESFINKARRGQMTWGTDNPKPGEMIAKYVDVILKGGVKAIPASFSSIGDLKRVRNDEDQNGSSEDEDVEITKQLDQVLDMFRFVHGKAVFEAFYKRDLARRLLLQRSASADAEKSMLTRLKSECGSGFTHNLEQMFKDIELAREEISAYKSLLYETKATSPIDLNVNVLSASAWPSYPDVALEIPRDIQNAIAGFEAYYKLKHSGRKLTWKHSLAHCQLKAMFPRGNKEIVVSSFQAIVLLLFNEKAPNENIPYTEIQAASNLDDTELKRTLQSLACAKYRVLTKTPKGKDVNDTDTFAVNLHFADPKYRIKINQIQAKETKEENKETHERVAADRNYETQAAIVRIMKTRKTISHAELVSEVIVATKSRGVLDPADIKKNIEKLIEKDYMERDESQDNRNVYNYLA